MTNSKLAVTWPLLMYAVITSATAWLLFTGTTWGVGTSPDSMKYISSASSILDTNSLNSLGTNFPPLYSMFISIGGLIHENIYVGARFQQIFLYAANTLMVGLIVFSATHEKTYSVLGMLLFSTSPFIYTLHAYAASEGLFFLFLFSGLYALNLAVSKKNTQLIVASAVLISLSSLTRYAGISVVIASILFVLLSKPKKRWVLIVTISLIPLSLWFLRNKLVIGNTSNRTLEYHPISIDGLLQTLNTVSTWLHLPGDGVAMPTLFLVLVGAFAYRLSKEPIDKNHANIVTFHKLLALFCSIYIALIITSISFYDALTPLDFRILSPVFVSGILYFSTCPVLLNKSSTIQRSVKSTIVALLVILIGLQIVSLRSYIIEYHSNGIGFSSKQWASSNIIKILSSGKYKNVIYTNAPEPISIYTDLHATMAPALILPTQRKRNPEFDRKIKIMEDNIHIKNGIYVHFNNIAWRWYLPSLETIFSAMKLHKDYSGDDGVILVYKST